MKPTEIKLEPINVLHRLRLIQMMYATENPKFISIDISNLAKDAADAIEELMKMEKKECVEEVPPLLNKQFIIGVDLANGPDISVDRSNQKIGKSCKGCTFDGPTCTNQHICIKDDLGYYTGYVSTTNPYIQNAVNREEDNGYPCHDSDCYDHGNYHFSCYTCPKIKNSKTVRNDRNETLNMARERLGLLVTDNTDIDWRFKV